MPAWAAEFVGIPFAEHGRDRDGCDCWGLARLIWAERAGLVLPTFATAYDRAGNGAVVAAAIQTFGTESGDWLPVSDGAERRFDAVEMRGIYEVEEGGRKVLRRANMHVGVVLGPGTLIHVERQIAAVLGEYRRDGRVRSRVVGFWRHRELADA